ncbi:TonB-dependent receptor, partial [Proteus mirabilis]
KYIEDQIRRLSTPKLANLDPAKLKENRLDGKEQRIGAYAMATFRTGDLTVIPGVRFEHNRFEGTYWQENAKTGNGFVTTVRSYDQW